MRIIFAHKQLLVYYVFVLHPNPIDSDFQRVALAAERHRVQLKEHILMEAAIPLRVMFSFFAARSPELAYDPNDRNALQRGLQQSAAQLSARRGPLPREASTAESRSRRHVRASGGDSGACGLALLPGRRREQDDAGCLHNMGDPALPSIGRTK